MMVIIQIILLVLALGNTYLAWLRTKYARDSLTLQRLDFKRVWSSTEINETEIKLDGFDTMRDYPHSESEEEEEFKVGGAD